MKMIATACALLVLFAAPTLAGFDSDNPKEKINVTSRDEITKICKLQPTNAGFEVGAEGFARFVESGRGLETAVKVLAALEDKTALIVSVSNRERERFDIGLIEMVLGVGVLQAPGGMNAGTNPLSIKEITTVTIRHGDNVLLSGDCGSQTIRE